MQIHQAQQPKLFELVKLYQIHSHSRTCWKYEKMKRTNADFCYGRFFTDRTIISKPLNSDIPQVEREKNNVLVKKYPRQSKRIH